MNRPSTAAYKERAFSNGSTNLVDAIDKKTLEWIEAGLPGLSPDNLQAVLARFFKEQDRAKAPSATTPAQSQRGGISPVYPPPTTHTQHGGSSYYRTTMAPQPGLLPAGQMPTFTYTSPAFAQAIMPPPSQYARVGAKYSTKTGTSGRPLPPTWTEAAKAQTGALQPPTWAPKPAASGSKPAAGAQKNAQPAPRVPAAPREPAASRMPGASRSSKRKTRSGSLERASAQRLTKKAAQAPAPSEA